MNKPIALMPDDLGWNGKSPGELHFNCVAAVCYVCCRHAVVLNTIYMRLSEIKQALFDRGWVIEPCDWWVCPECKDVPGEGENNE